jgi:signal transduction histidine kinase
LRLEQVVANLLDNAIKHSPYGEPIAVTLSLPEAGTIELAVSDRGIGIPIEARDRIFERFFQARPDDATQGLGLGLYVSRQIVELHGGEIRADFPAGGGTRFVVTLPIGIEALAVTHAAD